MGPSASTLKTPPWVQGSGVRSILRGLVLGSLRSLISLWVGREWGYGFWRNGWAALVKGLLLGKGFDKVSFVGPRLHLGFHLVCQNTHFVKSGVRLELDYMSILRI